MVFISRPYLLDVKLLLHNLGQSGDGRDLSLQLSNDVNRAVKRGNFYIGQGSLKGRHCPTNKTCLLQIHAGFNSLPRKTNKQTNKQKRCTNLQCDC